MKDISKLDYSLAQTIDHLKENWFNEKTGIVACALKDGDKIAFATSSKDGNKWLHAERNAYCKFKSIYGNPSKQAVFIITLSPCIGKLKYRIESSCFELIKSLGITRVHFGALDIHHAPTISAYSTIGLEPSLTEDPRLATICKNLMNLFSEYDSRINSELHDIKLELGNNFLSQIH